MTRLKFQGVVPYPPEDKIDDWGLTVEQQVRGDAGGPHMGRQRRKTAWR